MTMPRHILLVAIIATVALWVFCIWKELLSNFVDEPNQAASFSIFSPSMN